MDTPLIIWLTSKLRRSSFSSKLIMNLQFQMAIGTIKLICQIGVDSMPTEESGIPEQITTPWGICIPNKISKPLPAECIEK